MTRFSLRNVRSEGKKRIKTSKMHGNWVILSLKKSIVFILLNINILKFEICTGDAADIEKFSRRTVKVTPEHNAECKKLLSLMGIPYVEVVIFRLISGYFRISFINF